MLSKAWGMAKGAWGGVKGAVQNMSPGGSAALTGAGIGALGGMGIHATTGIAGGLLGTGDFPSLGSTMSKGLMGAAIGAGIGYGAFKSPAGARRLGGALGGLIGPENVGKVMGMRGGKMGPSLGNFGKGMEISSIIREELGRWDTMKHAFSSGEGGRLGAGLMGVGAGIGMYKSSYLTGSVSSNYGYR